MHLAVTEPDQQEAMIRLANLISFKPASSAGKKRMIKAASKKQMRDGGNIGDLEEEKKEKNKEEKDHH